MASTSVGSLATASGTQGARHNADSSRSSRRTSRSSARCRRKPECPSAPQAPQATKDIATAGAPQRDQFPYYLLFMRSNLFVARVGIFRRLHGVPFGSPNTLPRGPWLRVPAPRRVCCSTGVAGRAARLPDLVECPRTLRSRVLHSREVNGDVASREALRMRGERSCS